MHVKKSIANNFKTNTRYPKNRALFFYYRNFSICVLCNYISVLFHDLKNSGVPNCLKITKKEFKLLFNFVLALNHKAARF